MATQNQNNTGKQSGAPGLSNNFTGQAPNTDNAPKIDGGGKFTPSTSQSNIRDRQGR